MGELVLGLAVSIAVALFAAVVWMLFWYYIHYEK